MTELWVLACKAATPLSIVLTPLAVYLCFKRLRGNGFMCKAAKVIDFSPGKRHWGHNFQLCSKLDDDGYRWRVATWYPKRIEKQDVILLGLNHDDVRAAIVTDVDHAAGVPDMCFLTVNIRGGRRAYQQLCR